MTDLKWIAIAAFVLAGTTTVSGNRYTATEHEDRMFWINECIHILPVEGPGPEKMVRLCLKVSTRLFGEENDDES